MGRRVIGWFGGPWAELLLAALVLAVLVGGGLGLCRLVGFGRHGITVIERPMDYAEVQHRGHAREASVGEVPVNHDPHYGLHFSECTNNHFNRWGPRYDYDIVAWSSDGSEVYFTDRGDLWGVTADGWRQWLIATAARPDAAFNPDRVLAATSFAVAPDGSDLVYAGCRMPETHIGSDGTKEIRVADLFGFELLRVGRDGRDVQRLTETPAVEFYPAWSPDGRRIAFLSDAAPSDLESPAGPRRMGLYTMAADGTDVRRVLGDEFAVLHQPPQWSPDGRYLAVVRYLYEEVRHGYAVSFEEIGRELYVVGADGAKRWHVASNVVSSPSWSPDGQRLAYARANAEGVALFSVRTDGTDERRISNIPRWQAPRGHGFRAEEDATEAWIDTVAWSPDGARILVRSNDEHPAFVVHLETGHTTRIGFADLLAAEGRLEGLRATAWSPDGSRIAMLVRGRKVDGPGVVATVAADGTGLRVLAAREDPADPGYSARAELLPQRARYVPGPADTAACRTGGAVPEPDANERLVEECVDLLRVQQSLVGGEALNWSPERPMAEWDGVVLAGTPRRVRELDLGGRGLRGALREAIPRRPALRVLVLRDNSLDGWIPHAMLNQWNLEVIDLSNNQVSGPIASRLSGLDQLRVLDLSSNQLSGDIPARLAELPNLEDLALTGNQFTGCVPPGLPLRDRDELDLPTCAAAA